MAASIAAPPVPPATVSTLPTFSHQDASIYYEVRGDGEPLLAIAGLASDSQSWGASASLLARSRELILVDNRGCGRTRGDYASISVADLADDCAALLSHLGVARAAVLGHSMGGFVAMKLALRHRECVSKLVLAATVASSPAPTTARLRDWAERLGAGADPAGWFRELFRWIFSAAVYDDERTMDELTQLALAYPYPQSAADFGRQVEAIAGFDCRADLPRIAVPTLVLAGEHDVLFPRDAVTALARALPNARLAVVPAAAHALALENPARFSDQVLSFLGQGDGGDATATARR